MEAGPGLGPESTVLGAERSLRVKGARRVCGLRSESSPVRSMILIYCQLHPLQA